jgi:fucose 4-O-acetylase-like acetyltransferase
MFIISEKETVYSYIGPRTMAVYLFHGLTYNLVKDCTDILQNVNTAIETALLLGTCGPLTSLCAARPLVNFTNKISNLHFSDIGSNLPSTVSVPQQGYL